jgi:hypothetical protein
MTEPINYPLPADLLDSLDEVLRNEARWLIKDMAKTLGIPAAPLLKQVLDKKRSVYLYEKNHTDYQCKALVPQKNIYTYCRKPNILHTDFCDSHQSWSPPEKIPKQKLARIHVPYDSNIPALWLDKKTGMIYNTFMDVCGTYDIGTCVLTIFKQTDESP